MARKKYHTCNYCGYQILRSEEKPETCPECSGIYPWRPIKERELMLLQDKYFESNRKDKKAFQDMILIVEPILFNLIAAKMKSIAIYMDEEKRHDLVYESLIAFMEKYNNPNFRIKGSFIGYLQQLILNPCFNPKKKEREQRETSLMSPVKGSENLYLYHMIEVVEGLYGSEEWVLNKIQEEYQVEALSSLLDNIFKQCVISTDIKTALIIMRSLLLNIDPKVKESDVLEYWENYSNHLHVLADKSMKSIYDFVKKELLVNNQGVSIEDYKDRFGDTPTNNTILEVDNEEDS